MDKYNTKINILVGVFFFVSVLSATFLAINNSSELFTANKYYRLNAYFSDSSGLNNNSKITIAGVEVGKVSSIKLDTKNMESLVALDISKDIKLTSDTSAMILTSGLLGAKYIGLSIGSDEETLNDGDFIDDTQSSLNLESLISKFVAK